MQTHAAEIKNEQEILYFSSCYVSKEYGEIIFSVMRVEFIDQLCEREPVVALRLEISPIVVGLALKAILAESNKKAAKNNPLLATRLSDISQGKIFYNRNDYAPHQLHIKDKQTHIGNTYLDTPGYQASKTQTMTDFNKHYLHFSIQATNETIFATTYFNEWNPIGISKQVSLDMDNEVIGALFLGFSKLCI